LLYVQRLTFDQVGALLGVTNGNARVIAHRARRHVLALPGMVEAPDR
jgi:DNA-directed RNA polymerase specialized sigma24 family protein